MRASPPPSNIETLRQKVATVEPWAADLPPGPEFRRLRELSGVSQELFAPESGVSVLTIWRYETGRTTAPTSMELPQFRRAVTALYELALERRDRAKRQKALQQALGEAVDGVEATL